MDADNWIAPSGIGIRDLVWSLLALVEAFEPATEQEAAVVAMLLVDGESFLEATETE
jgi:hypothetical protein